MPCGIAVRATVKPAMQSWKSDCSVYLGSHSIMGKRRLSNLVVHVLRMRLLARVTTCWPKETSLSRWCSADPTPSDHDTLISDDAELTDPGSIWNEVSPFFLSSNENDSWRDESPILLFMLRRRAPEEINPDREYFVLLGEGGILSNFWFKSKQ